MPSPLRDRWNGKPDRRHLRQLFVGKHLNDVRDGDGNAAGNHNDDGPLDNRRVDQLR
jgi:hypothetical protein